MNIRQLSAAFFLLWAGASVAMAAAEDHRLSVPDVCTINAPNNLWTWKPVNEYAPEKGGLYVCTAENKGAKIILSIEPAPAKEDAERINKLKVHFNTLRESLQKMGCKEIKGKRPDLTPPIPEDVSFIVLGTTPKGQSIYYSAHTLFKDHVFLVYAAAPSMEEAQHLVAVEKTLTAPKATLISGYAPPERDCVKPPTISSAADLVDFVPPH
jgi:hypothetical protein